MVARPLQPRGDPELAAAAVSGDGHLLPRFRRVELDHHETRPSPEVEKALREAATEAEVRADPHAMPLDAARLRGLPAIGPYSGGSAMRGTLPHLEILLLDDRRKRKRRRKL